MVPIISQPYLSSFFRFVAQRLFKKVYEYLMGSNCGIKGVVVTEARSGVNEPATTVLGVPEHGSQTLALRAWANGRWHQSISPTFMASDCTVCIRNGTGPDSDN